MADRFLFRPSRLGDADTILPTLRREDLEEWDASIAGGISEHLEGSIRWSLIAGECLTVEDAASNLPLVIVGVSLAVRQHPITWMVMTKEAESLGVAIMYHHRDELTGFFERWPSTQCWSHAKNLLHHRWLEWLGYHAEGREVIMGPLNEGFLHFVKG